MALNLGSIIETLNKDGARRPSWCRSFVREMVQGDKRILDHRRQGSAFQCWRASRKAARCAATWPPAVRAWRNRCRRATCEIAEAIGPKLAPARAAPDRPGRDRRLR
jgi:hypothetical protein